MNFESKFIEAMEIVVNKILKKAKFDYTLTGKIVSGTASPYNTTLQGQEMTLPAREGLSLSPGDVVYIKVPQGDYSRKYIDCKKP